MGGWQAVDRRAFIVGGAMLAGAPAMAAVGKVDCVVHAGTLIDGVGAPRSAASILIADERIAEIVPGHVRPAGVRIVDLSSATVLPGFINCHIHLDTRPGSLNPVLDAAQASELDALMQSAANAREMLMRGFTSARVLGSVGEDAALKRGIDRKLAQGPRLWVALEQLGATGSVADRSVGFDEALDNPHWRRRTIDTPEQAAWQVRDRKKRGADLIKIMVGGAVTSLSSDPVGMQLMSDAEIRAVVETAHALGMKVAAHAYGGEAIAAAVRGGVASIEHGSFADDAALAAMRERGVYLVPTLTILAISIDTARNRPEQLHPVIREKIIAVGDTPARTVAKAHRMGVPIAFGSDAVLPDRQAEEFGHLVTAGLTPMQAIQAATRNAADLLGASDRVGTLQPGRFADIVAVQGDPIANIDLLRSVRFVMKGGVTVRNELNA